MKNVYYVHGIIDQQESITSPMYSYKHVYLSFFKFPTSFDAAGGKG